ncbi:TIM-barrel domain-containing protein [Lapidilactobacillus achengensis]|uniref:TIM-barrel domain-containing protein n=1 Tax=Lapidilactobacillus achengensis TaxID=2486000 RepID=A0ABW1UN06_9LACO|nr:glycoside hydrolase family 31 protein [Lapidilactobacillus achengensis]
MQIKGKHYRFTVLTSSLIRMEYSPSGRFTDAATQVVTNRNFPKLNYRWIDRPDLLEIITDKVHLYYDKRPFSAQGLSVELNKEFSYFDRVWHFGDRDLDTLKGTARTLDGADGAVTLDEGIVSRHGYSILDDSTSFEVSTVDMDDQQIRLTPRERGAIDLYYFGYQDDYCHAIVDFYHLTGNPPLIPRYALGNWWSRFWPYTSDSYLELMEKFRKEKIPLSVAVLDMDWHLVDIPKKYGNGWTGYTWNRKLFADPPRFLSQLHQLRLKTALNVHPASGIRGFEEAYHQVARKLGLDEGAEETAKFDLTNDKFVKTYFDDVHHPLEDQGVDLWWIDWQQGGLSRIEGLDPLWLLNYYHYRDSQRKGLGLILSRYAGPGSHRYPLGFSGDTVISWKSLNFQPYFTATASNIGYNWWSHDIGGHMGGIHDEELLIRWLQFGVFSPINRLHGTSSDFVNKEPWNMEAPYRQYAIRILQERHRWVPYLYTMDVRSHEKGIPLVLPLYYLNPDKEEAYHSPNEYLFGNQVMVAPTTSAIDRSYRYAKTSVWLPEGTWFDFYKDWKYSGNTRVEMYRRIDETLVFAKAGAIIPLAAHPDNEFGVELPETVEWHIFPGKNNIFTLIEDQKDQRSRSTLTVNWAEGKVELAVATDSSTFAKERSHILCFHAVKADSGLNYKLKIIPGETLDISGFSMAKNADMLPEIKKRMKNSWTGTTQKEQLWALLNQEQSLFDQINILRNHCDDFLFGMLYEPLFIAQSSK